MNALNRLTMTVLNGLTNYAVNSLKTNFSNEGSLHSTIKERGESVIRQLHHIWGK